MKRLLLLFIFAIAGTAAVATAQELRVGQFEGTTVAEKLTNAQLQCSGGSIPCYLFIDPTLATAAEGTLPTRCATCVWVDRRTYRISFPNPDSVGAGGLGVGSYKWLEINPNTSNGVGVKFNGTVKNFTQSANDNLVARLGWNITYSGTRENSSAGGPAMRTALALEWESAYIFSGNYYNEFHLAVTDINGALRRPMTFFLAADPVTGATANSDFAVSFNTKQFQFGAFDGTGTVYVRSVLSDTAKEWYQLGTADNAEVPWYRIVRNTALAGEAYISFQKAASMDYFKVANTGSSTTGWMHTNEVGIGQAPQSNIMLGVAAGGTKHGVLIDGNATGTIFSARNAGVPVLQASNAQVLVNNGSTLYFYSDNQSTLKGQISAATGGFQYSLLQTKTACANSGGTCAAAPAGSFSMAAAATTRTVATTAVTASSVIIITENSTLGTALSVTCNTTLGRTYAVTSVTAGTSFVVTASAAPATNPACLQYIIIN